MFSMTTKRTKLYRNHNNQCVTEASNPVEPVL